jgi:hypothetical protein
MLSNGSNEYSSNGITIKSSVLEGIIANINSEKASIEQIGNKLSTSFSSLTDSGLFENCLESLKASVSSISLTYDVLGSTISTHLNEVSSVEQAVAAVGNDYMSSYNYNSSSNGGSSYDVGGSRIGDSVIPLHHGMAVGNGKLEEEIAKLDIKSISSIVSFMCMVKEKNKSLAEILFDSDNSDYCATLLKDFYKVYGSVDIDYEDSKMVHEALLKSILNSNEKLPSKLTEATILQFSDYFEMVAKNNGMTSFDLITNSANKSVLSNSLKDLYDNKVSFDSLGEDYYLEFRAFVNMKAEKENKTVDEVLEDIENLL